MFIPTGVYFSMVFVTVEAATKDLTAKEIFVGVNRIAEEIWLNDVNERTRFESASSPSRGVYRVSGFKPIGKLNLKSHCSNIATNILHQ
jgi:hypothetical protein